MSTITRELAKLFRKITNSEIDAEGNAHVVLSPADSLLINNARIALASLEAEASGRNPVLAYADSYRDMAKRGVESIPVWSVITDLERNIAPLYTAPTAQVVPDLSTLDRLAGEMLNHAMNCERRVAVAYPHCAHRLAEEVRDLRAAMLQGADGALTDEDTKRVDELVMWIKRLAHSLRKSNPDSKLQSDAMDYLSRKGLISVKDILR